MDLAHPGHVLHETKTFPGGKTRPEKNAPQRAPKSPRKDTERIPGGIRI